MPETDACGSKRGAGGFKQFLVAKVNLKNW